MKLEFLGCKSIKIEFLGYASIKSEILGCASMKPEFLGCTSMKTKFLTCASIKTKFWECASMKFDFLGCASIKTEFLGCVSKINEFMGCASIKSELLGCASIPGLSPEPPHKSVIPEAFRLIDIFPFFHPLITQDNWIARNLQGFSTGPGARMKIQGGSGKGFPCWEIPKFQLIPALPRPKRILEF